jgi:hypothetical protein
MFIYIYTLYNVFSVNVVYHQILLSHRGGPGSRPRLASGICGGQSGVGAFSLSTSVSPAKIGHSTNFSILTITRGRYNRPVVAAVPSGPSMDTTPQYSHEKNKKKYYISIYFCLLRLFWFVKEMLIIRLRSRDAYVKQK